MIAVLFFASGEKTNTTYKTIHDAKSDSLFQRGWLPDILPPNAYNITSITYLDSNKSEGSFYIHPYEMNLFKSKLNFSRDNVYTFKSFTFTIDDTKSFITYTNQAN